MQTIKRDNGKHLKIECGSSVDMLSDPDLALFITRLDRLNNLAPLASFTFKKKTTPPTDYEYDLVTKDGRTWSQIVRIDGETRKQSVTSASTFWETAPAPEIPRHTELRQVVEALTVVYGITKIDATWD